MLSNLRILLHQGKQYIPDVTNARLPGIFRGRPVISTVAVDSNALAELCPTGAISVDPVTINIGKCTFCGECAFSFPEKICFTRDYKIASNLMNDLIIREGADVPIRLNPDAIREEVSRYFSGSLKLRQVCAGGDGGTEWELNACGNVNFDMGRFGVEFVASPRHADGLVITGPITENMAEPLQTCYEAIPDPKIIILAGTDAISGGIFADRSSLKRGFLDNYKIDLFVPGNPVHPLTFINGVLELIRKRT